MCDEQILSAPFSRGQQTAAAARRPILVDYRFICADIIKSFDVLAVVCSSAFAYWVRHGSMDVKIEYCLGTVLAAAFFISYSRFGGAYEIGRLTPYHPSCARIVACWLAALITLIAVGFFEKMSDEFSRLWLLYWFTSGLSVLLAGHFLVFPLAVKHLRLSRKLASNIVIIGSAGFIADVRRDLDTAASNNKVIAAYEFNDNTPADPASLCIPADAVNELTYHTRVDEVLVECPKQPRSGLDRLLGELRSLPVSVNVCLTTVSFSAAVLSTECLGQNIVLNVGRRPYDGRAIIIKRVEDLIVASILVVALSPLMAVAAIAIVLNSRGPFIFRQLRYGIGNTPITVLKFRTMIYNPHGELAVQQASRKDKRVTSVGRILRKTSLDELPQLFNVLRGDMSLVGPRPHAIAHNAYYGKLIENYWFRHRVKPGITGWAQVNGLRGETGDFTLMKKRVEYDLYYIQNWSLAFDLKILWKTMIRVLFDRNAY